MWKFLKNLYLEVRPNAAWDIVKYLLIAGISLLILLGYRFLAYMRELPQDRVVNITIFVGAFILIAGALALTRYRDNQIRGSRFVNAAPAPSSERIFVDITPEYLTGLFRKYTSFQATKLVDPYLGKWMKVSGFVMDVSSESNNATVHLMPSEQSAGFQIIAYFREQKWIDRTLVLRCSDKVSVLGQISRVRISSLSLEYCETVSSNEANNL